MRRSLGQPRGMKRVFLHVAPLSEGTWLAHPAALRGLWLQLQVYCTAQENGGRIVGAKGWRSEQWHLILGAGGNLGAVGRLATAELVRWDGEDLIVLGYDTDAEVGYQRQREGGRTGGVRSAERRAERDPEGLDPQAESSSHPATPASSQGSRLAVGNGGAESSEAREGPDWTGPPRAPASASPDYLIRLHADAFRAHRGVPYALARGDRRQVEAVLAKHPGIGADVGAWPVVVGGFVKQAPDPDLLYLLRHLVERAGGSGDARWGAQP